MTRVLLVTGPGCGDEPSDIEQAEGPKHQSINRYVYRKSTSTCFAAYASNKIQETTKDNTQKLLT
jgi:hypothetical protein